MEQHGRKFKCNEIRVEEEWLELHQTTQQAKFDMRKAARSTFCRIVEQSRSAAA
jgi:hypothetical protein